MLHLRFLQLQRRQVHDPTGQPVEALSVRGVSSTSWDEAVEQEVTVSLPLPDLSDGISTPLTFDGGEEVESLTAEDGTEIGKIVRRRWPLSAKVSAKTEPVGAYARLEVRVDNVRSEPTLDKNDAIRNSMIGAHLLLEAHGVEFISLLEPPDEAREAAAACSQHRCWPLLTGAPGDTDLVLGSPIILYDYPEIAAESAGALFDATEIDEILTLRVMTMTDAEKAEARATDPRAREIIDRCDEMSDESLQLMHGILRNPHAVGTSPLLEPEWPGASDLSDLGDDLSDLGDMGPRWSAAAGVGDSEPQWPTASDLRNVDPRRSTPVRRRGGILRPTPAVNPDVDEVVINGVSVSKGSLVRVHPNRRADAQDLFFADQVARVTAVLSDVDGSVHIALVLVDDPASDMHEWYGRYFYYAPDELEPLQPDDAAASEPTRSRDPRPQRGEPIVKELGMATTVLAAGVALVAVAVGVRSIPDIRRYFRIRSM
ncbi:MAG: hypothetical protein WKF83_14660 [Nocardioidaceae bacterium]